MIIVNEESLKIVKNDLIAVSPRGLMDCDKRRCCNLIRTLNRRDLARVEVNQLSEVRKSGPERIADSPMSDLAHMLLVDWVDCNLSCAVAVDRCRQQN